MQFNGREIDVKEWSNERLGSLVACDTETTFTPFHITPELCTVQVYAGKDVAYYVPKHKLSLFFNLHYESEFIFHNAPFDLDVLALKLENRSFGFDLIDRGKVWDTSILYRLYHLATVGWVPFKYSLAFLSEKLLNTELEKKDDVRLTFEQYKETPISEIPREHLEYGAKDAVATFDCFLALKSRINGIDERGTTLSHDIQVKGDFALFHIRKNGIGFDLEQRDKWLKDMNAKLEAQTDILSSWGWVRGLKGLQERYEQIVTMLGIADKLPRTESGDISSKGEHLAGFRHIPFVDAYLKFHELEKATTFVRDITASRVHPRYNVLVNTGRTSCSKPNFQQLPKLGGVREMFRSEEGKTFIITDYSAIELATLAQVTYDRYGESVMRDRINDGEDLHRYYASIMHSKEPKEVTKQERSEAKAANFGFPGGLGIDTFIQFSRGYGLDLTPSVAQRMKDTWFQAFPEMNNYMRNEVGHVFTLTGRKRNNTSYCAEKNTPFQGLAADGAKLALYELDKAGFRVAGFVHDEIITEVPELDAEELLREQERIMVSAMRQVVPDVKVGVESMLSKVYTK